MNFSNLNKVVLTASLLATGFSYADSDRPLLSLSVSQSGGTALNNEGSLDTRTPANQSRVLPIWGDEARARGYDIPEPFGIGYNYMNLRQDVVVDKIGFGSDTFIGQHLLGMVSVDVGHTRSSNESHMLKLDTWVFPFMNVYGIYGKTKGSSIAQLNSVNFLGADDPVAENLPFKLDYEGKSYGGGFTLAGGYNQFFGTFDLNYTKTNLDILDGDIKALVITPRVGYEFIFEPLITGQGNTKLQVWTGAMYQDITQRFRGDVSRLNLPQELDDLMNLAPPSVMGNIKFDVEQHLAHKWSNIIGARLEVTRNFNVITEFGFNNRNSFLISGEFRF